MLTAVLDEVFTDEELMELDLEEVGIDKSGKETFAEFIRRANPRFQFYPHTVRLIDTLQRVADGEIRRLMVFMPPRHGKSETVSRMFPAYYLYRYPERWVGLNSYAAALAFTLSRNARENYRRAGGPLTVAGVEQWETGGGGGLWAAGVGGPITGKGGHLLIIDDPLKNAEEAASPTIREKQKDWYGSTFYTRLEPNSAIVIVQCMTGDTPVLMADGTELPLREIKVGDQVATYDNGKLGISTVQNHRSNGADSVHKITMTCGKIVHANERHPFLVEEHGQLKWLRLKHLTTAHKIVTVKDSGASGKGKSVSLRAAKNLSAVRGTASHTTTRKNGPMGIALRRLTQSPVGMLTSNIGTESPAQSTMQCWQSKMVNALSANSHRGIMCERTGPGSCALTTAMTPIRSGGFCVTTVTLPWDMPSQKQPHSLWSNTSDFTTESIASIEPAGVEEVFDIQVERTENFIANGLVSHNTRWNEDDLSGYLLAQESEEPEQWHILNFPAIAEVEPQEFPATCTIERDERKPGEALCPQRYPLERLMKIARRIGKYFWNALFQQRPSAVEGTIFKRQWWRFWQPKNAELPPVRAKLADGSLHECTVEDLPVYFDEQIQSWDMAFKDAASSSFVVGQVWGRTGANKYLLDQDRDHRDMPSTLRAVEGLSNSWPMAYAKLVEAKANGPAVIQTLRNGIGGLIPVEPDGSKEARAYAIQPDVEAGNVYLPHPHIAPWVWDYIDEMATFPNGANDDQVDSTTQALRRLQLQSMNTRELEAMFAWRG